MTTLAAPAMPRPTMIDCCYNLSDFPTQAEAPSVRPLQRQWDPGMPNHSKSISIDVEHDVNTLQSSHFDDFVLTMMTVTMPSFALPPPSTRLRRQWDPGIAKDGIDIRSRPMARPLTPSVSIFHCCHPVLSRPTVPNVDS